MELTTVWFALIAILWMGYFAKWWRPGAVMFLIIFHRPHSTYYNAKIPDLLYLTSR